MCVQILFIVQHFLFNIIKILLFFIDLKVQILNLLIQDYILYQGSWDQRIITSDGKNVEVSKIDYNYVDDKLQLLRKESNAYMQSALRGEKNV